MKRKPLLTDKRIHGIERLLEKLPVGIVDSEEIVDAVTYLQNLVDYTHTDDYAERRRKARDNQRSLRAKEKA